MAEMTLIRKWALGAATVFAAIGGAQQGAATAGDLEEFPAVPSGFEVYLQEMLFELRQDQSRVARFRYVMPIIGQEGVTFFHVEQDFPVLCESHAVPTIERSDENVDQVIISLADRELEFGVSSNVATQYFEAFRLENGSCIWEGF